MMDLSNWAAKESPSTPIADVSDPARSCLSPFMWGRSHYQHPGQWLGTGNRCGHRPDAPAWHQYNEPETKRPLPHFIQNLINKVRDYYAQPLKLPTLANLSGKVNKLTGKPRQNRSEAREAESLVMQAILSRTDFASLRVGTPLPNGGFIHRAMTEISKVAGMFDAKRERPTQRFWRAIRRLKIAGAIDVHQQYEEKEDGSIRARPGIKTVNMHFLVALGEVSYEQLKRFRTYCSKALKLDQEEHKKQNPAEHDPAIANRRLRELQREKGIKTNPSQTANNSPVMRDRDQRKELQRQYSKAQLEFATNLHGQYPGRSSSWYGDQLRLQFPSLDDWIAKHS